MRSAPAHWEILPDKTKKALALLERMPFQKAFYLAGGTGLVLWLGHRVSVDLDFFSEREFAERSLLAALARDQAFRLEKREAGTIHGILNDVKIAYFWYPFPLLEPLSVRDGIAVASVADIACMKLEAIATRGTKRDFIDVYCIVQQGMRLADLLEHYRKKYARLDVNLLHVKKSLVYFADADPEPEPWMRTPVSWDAVKAFFRREITRL